MFIQVLYLILLGLIECGRHPILLVPGLAGSQIYGKYIKKPEGIQCYSINKTFPIWVNPIYFTPVTIDCIINNLLLKYNVSSHSTFPPNYIDTEVPGFGTVDTIGYLTPEHFFFLKYFINMINELERKENYSSNVDIRGAPYDFRKGPHEIKDYFANVKGLIEEMFNKSKGKSIILIGHSLGNLYILNLLNEMSQAWKDKYIRSFISVSGPYGGTAVALRSVLSGFHGRAIFINNLKLRKMESTWPSLYYLLPTVKPWLDFPIVLTKNQTFSAKNISALMKFSKINNAPNHYDDVKSYLNNILPPNVEVHCLISSGIETSITLDYRNVEFPDEQPNVVEGDGDGVVPLQSLLICPQWKTMQKQTVTLNMIPKVNHIDTIIDSAFINLVNEIVHKINSE